MNFRAILGCIVAALALTSGTTPLGGQESPVRRLANIVSVAVDEYGKGVDQAGRLTSVAEYQEALDFLADARKVVERLPGDRAAVASALLDSIVAAMNAKQPPSVLVALDKRFSDALGTEATLELPRETPDAANGERLYQQYCASCHGARGLGDGPAGAGLDPRPPAIGDAAAMIDASPGMMFRKISVGVSGTAMQPFASVITPEQRWNIVVYLASLRTRPERIAEGEGLYTQWCLDCHGPTGAGDGAVARTLSKLPPEIGSFGWQAAHSDSQIIAPVRRGVSLVEMREHRVAHGLHRRDDEEAAERLQLGQIGTSRQQVLDLGGDVEGHVRKLAVERALPHLSHAEVCWRLHFTFGIEHMTHWDDARLAIMSGGECDGNAIEESIERAIAYAEAAFRAPSTPTRTL